MATPTFVTPKKVEHVKPVVVKKVEEQLKKGRRYFGSSGANFTEQAFNKEWKDREGSKHEMAEQITEAEREFTLVLKKWLKDKPNAVLIDSVYTPDTPRLNDSTFSAGDGLVTDCYTGHVVLIGNEIFIIDSLPFKKKKRYSLDEERRVLQTNKEFEFTPYAHMSEKFEKWLNYLDEEALLTAIVGFTGEEATTERYKTWYDSPYRLLEYDRYIEFLDAKYGVIEDEDKESINPNLVAQVLVRAVKPYDKYETIFNSQALKNFK